MDRLFVAALPDAATIETLRRLPRPDERGVRWVAPESWHVTLRFLGSCESAEVAERLTAATLPRVRATLGPAVEWLGPQIVVPVSGVDDLATTIQAATDAIGEPPSRHFRGHLTIARTRRAATSTVVGHPVRGGFEVREVVLVRSEPTPDGARYTVIASYATE